ncbi:hypothetical protein [Pengzhenrongella frigida]|uniref:Uncharacterized protein n=1 Tax=Pengzhenrongella frigida TaxID=1259133 RepID=A0A4Q5MY85_9MICO|nr:hypothetical protein [Cellulomonas sp. HLT2-17]RYV50635.1 hypothetical protein EUA98_12315 [Cellulomonas sp. HLT2-17]
MTNSEAVITTICAVSANDTTTAGVAYLEARARAGSSLGQSTILGVTAGASVYVSGGTVAYTEVLALAGGATVTAGLQLRASNGAAYMSWKAQASTSVVWTR